METRPRAARGAASSAAARDHAAQARAARATRLALQVARQSRDLRHRIARSLSCRTNPAAQTPMFIGHYALGLAAKKFAPKTSLGTLFIAPTLADMLWPIFLLLG